MTLLEALTGRPSESDPSVGYPVPEREQDGAPQ